MKKICLIHQPAGIGDILYTLQIASIFNARGYRIIWPIIDQYCWLPDRLQLSSVEFVSESSDYIFKSYSLQRYPEIFEDESSNLYVPLSKSTLNSCGRQYPLMLSKYGMLGLEKISRSWHYFVSIERNLDKEQLVVDHYQLDLSSDYIFCNNMIGSPDGHLQELPEMKVAIERIKSCSNLPILYNEFIDRTTLFDFIPILMAAKEVHLPNSALTWLVEYLVQRGLTRADQKRFCYPRDRCNPINDNYKYIKGCWDESNWFFVPPTLIQR